MILYKMIVLKIFLGIIWAIVVIIYSILCGLHIKQLKLIRIIILAFLGFLVFIAYFVFPKIIWLSLCILGLILYAYWEHREVNLTSTNFNPSQFSRAFEGWIFIKDGNDLIYMTFPKFLKYLVIAILSISKRFRPFLKSKRSIEIEVQSENEIISIHI